MNPEDFIRGYEQALATQDWSRVQPLMREDVCVTFSNGAVHKGMIEVRKAFEKNFSLINDESYFITNIHWAMKNNETAVYLFEYNWSGIINDKPANGSGRGSAVIVYENDKWQLLLEHLGPKP